MQARSSQQHSAMDASQMVSAALKSASQIISARFSWRCTMPRRCGRRMLGGSSSGASARSSPSHCVSAKRSQSLLWAGQCVPEPLFREVRESSRLQSNDSVITARGQEVKRRFRQTDTNHTQAAWPSEQVVKRGMGWVGAVCGTGSRRGWRAAVTAAHSPAGTTAPAHNDTAAILRRMQPTMMMAVMITLRRMQPG